MKHVKDYLSNNGLSEVYLNSRKFLINTKVRFNNNEYDANVNVSNFNLTEFAYPDALLTLNLFVKVFYVQWFQQYKTRKYFKPKNNVNYSITFQIDGFNFEVLNHSGFGNIISPEEINLMLMITFVSLPKFVKNLEAFSFNPLRYKFYDFIEDVNKYIDTEYLISPQTLLNKSIREFFELGSISFEPTLSNLSEYQAEKNFIDYIEKENQYILDNIDDYI